MDVRSQQVGVRELRVGVPDLRRRWIRVVFLFAFGQGRLDLPGSSAPYELYGAAVVCPHDLPLINGPDALVKGIWKMSAYQIVSDTGLIVRIYTHQELDGTPNVLKKTPAGIMGNPRVIVLSIPVAVGRAKNRHVVLQAVPV